jgi:hypothetical protein
MDEHRIPKKLLEMKMSGRGHRGMQVRRDERHREKRMRLVGGR